MRMPKLSIDSLSMLYEDQQVRKFIKIMNNGSQEDDIYKHLEVCFLRAQNLKEAFIFAALSFSGLNIINLLKQYGIPQEVLAKLSEQLKRYSWDGNKTALQIYRHNAKRIGDNYAEIYNNIISKISEGDAQKIFNEAKEYYLLTGVKIRNWEFGKYRQIKRQNENAQIGNQDGVQYLLFCKAKSGDFYVGIIKDKSVCYQSQMNSQRNSFAMPELYDKNLGENNNKASTMHPQIQIQIQQQKYQKQNTQNQTSIIKSTDAPPSTKDMGTFPIQQQKINENRVHLNKDKNQKKDSVTVQKSQSQNVDPFKRWETSKNSQDSRSFSYKEAARNSKQFSNNEEAIQKHKNSQQSAEIKNHVGMNEKKAQHEKAQYEKAQREKAEYEKAQREKAEYEKAQREKAQYEKALTKNKERTDEMKIGSQSNKNGVKEKEKEKEYITNISKNPPSIDDGNFNSSNKINSNINDGRIEPKSYMQQPKKERKIKEQQDYSEDLQNEAICGKCCCSIM